jgi:DNA polymerase III subunit gamma/tau
MPDPSQAHDPDPASVRGHDYVVVARRYRPQTFEDLIGQEHVARALSNAITTQRVGHAYLFTGARGVGKTSAARILAKALNCEKGPAPVPCNQCDICRSISAGDDVDVLEIDGASNRGIDEIRQLRQNVNVRPSRERFKVYIIDEVHMLTREAFNALLKTLEEPPEHVKFIFCTTEPTKIPITILSRCQRFDFAGIRSSSIAERLRQIVQSEGVLADPEALELLARRAAGSMRDSQSLLEQLLSFAPGKITVADVNSLLGTAGEERLAAILTHLVARNPGAALGELDAATTDGVDPAQLLEQLLGYFRDCMMAAVGLSGEMFLFASPSNWEKVTESAKGLGLNTILAAMQILDHTLSRMRLSTQGRALAELALVEISHLEELSELPGLVAQLQSGAPPEALPSRQPTGTVSAPTESPGLKKNVELATPALSDHEAPVPAGHAQRTLTPQNAVEIWTEVIARTAAMASQHAKHFASVAISAPNRLVVSFRAGYTFSRTVCEQPEQKAKFEEQLAELTGQRVQLEFVSLEPEGPAAAAQVERQISPQERLRQAAAHPMVRRAGELFGAQPTRADRGR